MKTACIYHSIDLDGWMSAAIVKHWSILNAPMYIDFIGYNYGKPIPDLSEYDKVIMCDISFSKEEMLKLVKEKQSNFIWIDHHQRTIDETLQYIFDNNTSEPSGYRTKGQLEAACELTWKYFFLNEEMPEIVRLLGRYDCFGHKGTDEEQQVLEFQYGARDLISDYEDAYNFLIDEIKNKSVNLGIGLRGEHIYSYLCTEAMQTYKNGFEVLFLVNIQHSKETAIVGFEKLRYICINKERFNPINFGIDYHKEGYDGAACFHYDAPFNQWKFSLYNDNGKVDCSLIAQQFGGGGHKGAAGFVLDFDEFNKLINNK